MFTESAYLTHHFILAYYPLWKPAPENIQPSTRILFPKELSVDLFAVFWYWKITISGEVI